MYECQNVKDLINGDISSLNIIQMEVSSLAKAERWPSHNRVVIKRPLRQICDCDIGMYK